MTFPGSLPVGAIVLIAAASRRGMRLARTSASLSSCPAEAARSHPRKPGRRMPWPIVQSGSDSRAGPYHRKPVTEHLGERGTGQGSGLRQDHRPRHLGLSPETVHRHVQETGILRHSAPPDTSPRHSPLDHRPHPPRQRPRYVVDRTGRIYEPSLVLVRR